MDTDDAVARLVAEAEIRRVVERYCHGVDRLDLALVRACYHDGATDEHGSFHGDADAFVAWLGRLLPRYSMTMHLLGQTLVEWDGPGAATAESYGVAYHRGPDDHAELNLATGFRYVDRFEARDGRWAIAGRIAVTEWSRHLAPGSWWPIPETHRRGRRDGTDASDRPRP